MPRQIKIALAILAFGVVAGAIYLRVLHRHVQRLAVSEATEEQARREVVEPPITTPTDVMVKAELFWLAATDATRLEPAEVELPLSAEAAQRAKQVLRALISDVPNPEQRTLPADATLLDFYVLPDGTAVADFSDTISGEIPSGILSEKLAVDSITRTLEANVTSLRRLKILIHGQEAETLAGHLDLTGFFDLHPAVPPAAATPAQAAPASPPAKTPAAAKPPGERLTGTAPPGKLKP
jgi:Sporulation and spore germination